MHKRMERAVVLGAGTMGAQLAAHLANAGLQVTLLDIPPSDTDLEEGRSGPDARDRSARNRIAQQGLKAALDASPAAFFVPEYASRVQIGNLEDDLECVAEADWVIEAVIEDLAIKRELMARLDELRGEHTIVSTNTSGIPVAEIAAGRSKGFREHFLGTHFFNPPRYLKLLEIIPLPENSAELLLRVREFAETRLGKGVVVCKDTPNFIANRLGSVGGAFLLDFVLRHGYTVEEVDALTGPLIGRPKTATFRLLDLVGIDVASHVRRNLAEALPNDEALHLLQAPEAEKLMQTMLEREWLGVKSGVGFYKRVEQNGKREFWPLDLETMEHRPPGKPRFESVGQAKDLESAAERLKAMLAAEDRGGALVRALVYHGFSYASNRIPEIADTTREVDDAVRWGFGHAMGPFETWEALGIRSTAEAMDQEGFPAAKWVEELLSAGMESFYEYEGPQATAAYDPAKKAFSPIDLDPKVISLPALKSQEKVVDSNDGASLIDLGEEVLLLEFHTKANALDEDIFRMLDAALERTASDFQGLVIGNLADNFSLGANLFATALAAQNEMWEQLEEAVCAFQELNMRMRYSSKPIVVAPAGMALGGGCELVLSAPRRVAAAESYVGLVEVGAGVIPAGSGCKEMLRRIVNPAMRTQNADDLPFLQRVFETIGQAKVGRSAEEARKLGYLETSDRVVMNRDHLIAEAKREVLHMAPDYLPPQPEAIYAAGRDALAAMRIGVYALLEAGYISEYDAHIGRKLAYVLSGGDLSEPAWVDEWYILDLEREAFLSLVGEEKTQQRMWHLLQTGKPLRN